jgi:hypothetical protein
MKFRLLLFTGLLVLANSTKLFAEPLHDAGYGALKNAVILIIRHAEQQEDGQGLSPAGDARARAYVNYFTTFTIDGRPLKLDYLFASKDSSNSHRPGLTIQPIATKLGLMVDSRFKNRQFSDLVDEIQSRPHGANILICWHHGKIPQIIRALGADPKQLLPNGRWPDDVFGWLILLRYDENGNLVESKRINEQLSGDERQTHSQLEALQVRTRQFPLAKQN